MSCLICKENKKLIDHHLSYDPEIVVRVCWACHVTMHQLARKSKETRKIIIDWIEQYGHLWKNGHKKYSKTETRRNSQIKYREEHPSKYYWTKSSEKLMKRIKDMERKIKLMEKLT